VRAAHELFLHLLECLELFIPGPGEVGSVPNVEAVDHHHVVEARARSGELLLDPPECSSDLILERFDVRALIGATRDDRSGQEEQIARPPDRRKTVLS